MFAEFMFIKATVDTPKSIICEAPLTEELCEEFWES